MEVSAPTGNNAIGVEVQKKAQDVQAQQVLKVLDNADKVAQDTVSQATTAQKTGLGNSLNIVG